jgi:aspartyl-tRNA(Asn)/glutamyl-tRNA(Gln) amidotransferase subunit A
MGSSLDQVGPFGKNVNDTEILFNAIVGYDPKDSTSIPENMRNIKKEPMKKRIGVPREFLSGEGIDKDVLKNFEEVVII